MQATSPAGHPQLPAPAAAGRAVHKTATIENDQQGCKGNGGTRDGRSQTIPHGVSPLKSGLDAGHRAEPFPQGTVGPWKRWWCGGRPITGPYLLKGLPFPLVSCPHGKGREGSVSSTSDRSAGGANNLRHNPAKLQLRGPKVTNFPQPEPPFPGGWSCTWACGSYTR